MHIFRMIMAAQQRRADKEIMRVLRRQSHHDPVAVELQRRLLRPDVGDAAPAARMERRRSS
jgi:hypothetical protein